MPTLQSTIDPQTSEAAQNILSFIQETQDKKSASVIDDALIPGRSAEAVTVADNTKFSLLDE
jgi:hypothetical protein